jgi:hypothetical protein
MLLLQQMLYGHPDPEVDIAVMPVDEILNQIEDRGDAIYWNNVSSKDLPAEDSWSRMTAGWEVIFIGYPSGWFDDINLTPIFRTGTAATVPTRSYKSPKVSTVYFEPS